MSRILCSWLLALACLTPGVTRAGDTRPPELLVFAASSLANVLEDIGKAYTASTGQAVKFSFAASAVVARQIESGARADVFFSADDEWMDYLGTRRLIDRATRHNVVGNRLALIAPSESKVDLKIAPNFALLAALGGGRLSTGDPDYVPVGRYARSALTTLGVWNDVADRLVRADNVRAALAFVARGEAPLGIVYLTDALSEPKVRIVDLFALSTHVPIVYPAAVVEGAKPGARAFVDFLATPVARDLFAHYRFTALPGP
jgi:molybdate transport system substrate-binding protein